MRLVIVYTIGFIGETKAERTRSTMNKILERLQGQSANKLLKYAHCEDKIPVDIVGLAENIGFKLNDIDFTELEQDDAFKQMVQERGHILGAVFVDDDIIQILYQDHFTDKPSSGRIYTEQETKNNLSKRQRFTIAHEIAHCCLHMQPDDDIHVEYRMDLDNYVTDKEHDANVFAGELLIPELLLNRLYEVYDTIKHTPAVETLSEMFAVSKSVMKARLDYLGKPYIVRGRN